MFRSYLTAAARNLRRNKSFAAINVTGLAVGFAAALLIALIVRSELTHDRFFTDHERMYRVSSVLKGAGQADMRVDMVRPDIAQKLKAEFPVVEDTARLTGRTYPVRHRQIEATEKVYWADASTFDVLPLPAIAGDTAVALNRPDGIVITRRVARKYFGRDDPIGETLEIDRKHLMEVTAVLEDLPGNTHLDTEIFASGLAQFSRLIELDAIPAANQYPAVYTYVRLRPNASLQSLIAELPAFIDREIPGASGPGSRSLSLEVVPIGEVHLTAAGRSAMKPSGSRTGLAALTSIGALIVLAAATNFVNLMTARASRRSIEVGVRKAFGTARRHLIVQFIGESMLYALLALLLSFGLVEMLLPFLYALLDRDAPLELWTDPVLMLGALASAILISVLAGIYPALVLSSFRPNVVLKSGSAGVTGSGGVRHALVVVQSAILIGLLLATAIIYQQTRYAMGEGLRLDKDQVLLIETSIEKPCNNALKDEIRRLENVSAAACSFMAPFANGISNSARAAERDGVMLFSSPIDFDFFEVYGLEPLAGRLFSMQRADSAGSENSSMAAPLVINETAVRKLGFSSNQAAIQQTVTWKRLLSLDGKFSDERASEIVGVVPDFPMGTIHEHIEPTAYYVDPALAQFIHVKLRSEQDVLQTLREIDALWARLGDPRPIARYFVDEQLQTMYATSIRQEKILTTFAVVALFIASLGIYGIAAFGAERRKREIAVRKALGAGRADIVRLLLWQFTRPVVWANLIAWPVVYFVMRGWLQGFAYHVDLSLWMFVVGGLAVWIISCVTVLSHILRAASVKPAITLRYE